MADFVASCVRPDLNENETRLPISSEKPADVASPYHNSSSVPATAKNGDEEFKKIDQSLGEALETSWKLISCFIKSCYIGASSFILNSHKQLLNFAAVPTIMHRLPSFRASLIFLRLPILQLQPTGNGGNPSSKNASVEQEVSYNRVAALHGDENVADCTRSEYGRCGMHEDLLFDIMLWLPVVSLLRFRSVCRLWRSLIDSSAFITQHYNHNSNKNFLLARHVVSSYAGYDFNFCLLSGNMYEMYSNLDYEQPWHSVKEITILNSCNGIVSLFNEESGDVALWNPATKQLRPLPESSSMSHQRQTDVKFGFGFDAKSNDYKIVKICCYEKKHNNLVEVYNLRTDSWRTIYKDDVLPFQLIHCSGTLFKNGNCFWTGYPHSNEDSPILIYFDLNNEVFETMPLPGECRILYHALDLLNNKLCYIAEGNLKPFESDDRYFEIWMLDEYGVKESWKKICTVGPIGCSLCEFSPNVLGFSKNGEFLLLGDKFGYGELCLFNLYAREEEHLELQSPKSLPSKFVCCNKLQNPNPVLLEYVCYNESLVSLKREDDGAYK